MNLDLAATCGGGLLVVSQFTLAADTAERQSAELFPARPAAELGRRLYERVLAGGRARATRGRRRRVRRRHEGPPRQRRAGDDPAHRSRRRLAAARRESTRVAAALIRAQSAYWPAALMTGPHLLISASTNFLCSAPLTRPSVTITAPSASSRLTNSGSFSAALQRGVDLVDHRLRRALGRVQAVPDRHVEALQARLRRASAASSAPASSAACVVVTA